jgi:valine dehydrogenase (NAD+)
VGVFDRTDHLKDAGHEQVVFCQDRASGLKAIIAVYSTALGPALGGTRFYPYASEDDALEDVLKLSKAMAYKAACSGIDLGGGKAVILGDPTRDKTEALLRAYGRFVQSLGGRYYTACDVGTYVQDMDVIAKETDFATGRSPENGGAGRQRRAHGLRRLPGDARRRRARLGAPDAARQARRGRGASARSVTTSWSTWSRTAPPSSSAT